MPVAWRSSPAKACTITGFHQAAEACLSGPRILAQIERRYARLAAVKHDVPEFAPFFDDVLVPSLRRFETAAVKSYRQLGFDLGEDLAPQFRTLIPSDKA